jgi:hypothetical protein
MPKRERGRIQEQILREITAGVDDAGAVDYKRAGRLVAARLSRLSRR